MQDCTMQDRINDGTAWRMEGSVGRAAMSAIRNGDCTLGHIGHVDAYGSYVPSRYEVERGTVGSPEHAGQQIDREDLTYLVRFGDGTEHEIDAPQLFGVFSRMHAPRFAPVTILTTV